MRAEACSTGMEAGSDTIRWRGVMISRVGIASPSTARWIKASWKGGSAPPSRAAVAMSLSSSGEWTWPCSAGGVRKTRRTSAAERLRSTTAGRVICMKASMGAAIAMAIWSPRRSASDLGTSSPSST